MDNNSGKSALYYNHYHSRYKNVLNELIIRSKKASNVHVTQRELFDRINKWLDDQKLCDVTWMR